MTLKKNDIFHEFTKAYIEGNFLQALQIIISHPNVLYDDIVSKESILPHLINYADACVFGDIPSID